MKRVIKFRAWDGYTMAHFRIGAENPFPSEKNLDWITDQTLMQFTGLLDKNGKEIYEGDWIKHTEDDGTTDNSVVQWSTSYKPGFDTPCQLDEHLEVIGNIYENKDLL